MKSVGIKLTLCLSMLIMLLTACSGNELVGKWTSTVNQGDVKINIEYEFNSDGTMAQVVKMDSQGIGLATTVSVKGTYTFKDGVITYKVDPKNVKVEGLESLGIPKDQIATIEEETRQQIASRSVKIRDVSIKDGELKGNSDGMTVTLKKQ